jgi:hypothetical protein
MTISSITRVAGPFTGNGTTATFPFTFKVFAAPDLYVVLTNLASGQITLLGLTTDYSVALDADQDTNPGGSITLTAGNLAAGFTLTITTAMPELQNLDLTNGGGFYPDDINAALDTIVILIQQMMLQLGRAVQISFGDAGSMQLPSAAQRAGNLLMFDASGNIQLVPVASGGIVPGAQTAAGTVDGDNKIFTFSAAAGPTPSILVYAGGIFQDPATDYGAPVFESGTTWQITFTDAPPSGPIKILMLG